LPKSTEAVSQAAGPPNLKITGCRRWLSAEAAKQILDQARRELVEARNRLARAIAGAAMSGMTQDEIVEMTGYRTPVMTSTALDQTAVDPRTGDRGPTVWR
jgi:hypothetical protein